MLTLWLSIAVVTTLALVVLLWPWLRGSRRRSASQLETNVTIYRGERDQVELDLREGRIDAAERDRAIAEIESRLIQDIGPGGDRASASPPAARSPWLGVAAAALAVFVPAAAVGLYALQGNPFGTPEGNAMAVATQGAPAEGPDPEIMRLADSLAERLKQNPDDAKGWALLARTNHSLGRLDVAASAYARALELEAKDARLLADYATLVAQQQQSLAGKPIELARAALAIDPQSVPALALLASAAEGSGNVKESADLWQRVLGLLPAESEDAAEVRRIIGRLTGTTPPAPPIAQAPATPPLAPVPSAGATAPEASPQAPSAQAAAGGPAITGRVTITPELEGRVTAGDTLFIFARLSEGPRMPLAAIRIPASNLPFEFRLDDSMSMGAGPPLSTASSVIVEARISKTGQAIAQPGDLFGRSSPVPPGASALSIVIDSAVP